jgi:hypothetical protein
VRINQAQRIGWAPRIDRARRIDQAQLSDIIFLGSHTCHTRIDEDGWLPRRSSDPDHWSHIWHTLC